MVNEITFQKYLERLIGINGTKAESTEKVVVNFGESCPEVKEDSSYLMTRLLAREIDRSADRDYSEDFIIGPLSNNVTLYVPHNLVEAAIDFYSLRDFQLHNHKISRAGYDETLRLRDVDGNPSGMVHFDLGKGFRKDNQLELWVTTAFI